MDDRHIITHLVLTVVQRDHAVLEGRLLFYVRQRRCWWTVQFTNTDRMALLVPGIHIHSLLTADPQALLTCQRHFFRSLCKDLLLFD